MYEHTELALRHGNRIVIIITIHNHVQGLHSTFIVLSPSRNSLCLLFAVLQGLLPMGGWMLELHFQFSLTTFWLRDTRKRSVVVLLISTDRATKLQILELEGDD